MSNRNRTAPPSISPRASPRFQARFKPVHLYNVKKNAMAHYRFLRNKKVLAFSGLGDNQSFFQLLRQIGADVVQEIPFPDHHRYTAGDLRRMGSAENVQCIVTTEKDAVKLMGMDVPDNLFYLSIEARIEDEDTLMDLLLKKLGTRSPDRLA